MVPDIPDKPVRHGPRAVIEFFRDWMDRFEGLDLEWELEEAGPNRALAFILRMVLYFDLDEARPAAGLASS